MNAHGDHEVLGDKEQPRHAFDRLTRAGRPEVDKERLTQPPSRESADQKEQTAVPAWLRRLRYYGLAVLLVAAGAVVRLTLTYLVGPGLPTYITFYPFVMLSALIGGLGPGILATVTVMAVVDHWLLLPRGLFKIESMVDLVGLTFFFAISAFMSIVAELYRRMRSHLEELVVVRTMALSQANEQLREQADRLQAQSEELTTTNSELHASEERFRRLFEDDLTGDFLCTPEGRILLCNPAFAAIFGFPSCDEALGTNMVELYIEPGERGPLLEALRRQKRLDRFETWRKRRDGTAVYVVENLVGHFNDRGELYEVKGYIFDDTGRRRAEETLRELNATLESKVAERTAELEQRARQLQEAWAKVRTESEARIAALEQLRHEDRLKTVGRLASGIAHELGTPLNVISGYAGMIVSGSLSSHDVAESAGIIKAQSERIANIVRQILDFARRRPSQRTAVDLQQLARQTLDLVVPLAQKQNVGLILAAGEGAAVVDADAEQIRQVLLNLITNAVQAMRRSGNVEVAVGPASEAPPSGQGPPGEYVCISVRDEGEGIVPENLPHLFEPFFTTKGPGKGTGLGLAIADGIVREHGGRITVESTPGKGSRFCVHLPKKKEETCQDKS